MENKRTAYEIEIGRNLLIGFGFATLAYLGSEYMNFKNKSSAIRTGMPVKDKSETGFEFDPKTKKLKLSRKTEFEAKETKTIIKEVPVVPGFKKTKKVQVEVDKNGIEIPGTQQDFIG